jgi:hypothetical protein
MAEQWYYASQGQQKGPIAEAHLRQLAATHVLRPTDLVWKQGFPAWMPASSVPGLFTQFQAPAAPMPAPNSFPAPGPNPYAGAGRPLVYEHGEPALGSDYDDEYPTERKRRRKKRKKTGGVPVGLIIGLIAGGLFFGILLVGSIVWITSMSSGPGGWGGSAASTGGGSGTYRIEYLAVNPGANKNLMHHKQVWLNAGRTVSIQVKSDVQDDVDCYLFNPNGIKVAQDFSLSKDCNIIYQVQQSGNYTIVVDNLGMKVNKCTVTYTSSP